MSLEVSDNITDLRSWFLALEALRSAAPDDGADDTDDNDDDDDEDEDSGSGGTGEEADKDDKSNIGDPDKKRLSDEAAKHRRLRKEAEQRAAALDAKVKELEGKDKSAEDKLKQDLEAEKERADKAAKKAAERARAVAISQAAKGKNIADEDYLGYLLDKVEDIEYEDEDGDIVDLSDTVDALIKKHPRLVATGGGKDDDDDKDDPAQGQPSGRRTDGKQKGSKGGTDFDSLAKKFPALARR